IVACKIFLEGDGGVGAVKQFNFNAALKDVKYVKDRIVVLDHENYIYNYTILEGGQLGTKLKSTAFEVKMEPTNEGGTKTILKLDYETLGDTPLSDEELKKMVANVQGMSKAIEDHHQANPDLFA
ncbi:major strawberry allergen Fra a 1.08-like, partial [Aristolochia californica]|uniref:major strawberry allergen Fra a 1.08-like n=1 Tax=Aristolochia californica TaxID=171875 RepID=UPI0035E0D3F5